MRAIGSAMSQVNVTINGRQFRMACEDGAGGASAPAGRGSRRAHRRGCALQFGEIGDTRLTVMAALTVADELAEADKKLKRHRAGDSPPAGGARAVAPIAPRPPRPRSPRRSIRRPSASRA